MTDEDVGYTGPSRKPGEERDDDGPPDGLDLSDQDLALAYYPQTDMGNAERLVARFGEDMAYLDDGAGDKAGSWLVWDGTIWQRDGGSVLAHRKAQETAKAMRGEWAAMQHNKAPGWKGLRNFASSCQNSNRLRNMLREATPRLMRRSDDFDNNRRVVVVENGTIHLPPPLPPPGPRRDALVQGRRAVVQPVFKPDFNRSDMMTRRLPVVYMPEAGCPKFEAFLEQVQPDGDVRRFLQCFFGYSLSGEMGAQMLLLFYGQGANGKSTLLSVMSALLGDYAVNMRFESFQPKRGADGASHTGDLARLIGRRLATASEPDGNPELATGTIKLQTGGEKMPVRDVGEKAREFWPTHKTVLSFNRRPRVQAQDDGTWRRLAMVPWDVQIPKEERVRDLDKMLLEEEASGILNWMLEGWEIYADQGLVRPEAVVAATEDYQISSDPLALWAADCLEFFPDLHNTDIFATGKQLRASYEWWCQEAPEEPINKRQFGVRLKERRDMLHKKISATRYYGVRVRDGKTGEVKDGMV